jgi:hypothetical protein
VWLFLCSVRRLLVTADVVPSSPILVTMMKEALSYSETSVLTRATWRNIPKDGILQVLHGSHQLLAYDDDILLCHNIDTLERETLQLTPIRRFA